MADAYGVFIFAKSDDCVVDTQALVDAMNEFDWDSSGGEWVIGSDNQTIFHNCHSAQYPTVFPERVTELECYCDETGTTYLKSPEDMTDEDWENEVDVNREDVMLREIKAALEKHITTGWIEIAFTSNEKNRHINFGSIRIAVGEQAIRRYAFASTSMGSTWMEEWF